MARCKRLLRLRSHDTGRRTRALNRLHRQQNGELGILLRGSRPTRRRALAPSRPPPLRSARFLWLGRDEGKRARDQRGGGEDGDECPEPARRPPLDLGLADTPLLVGIPLAPFARRCSRPGTCGRRVRARGPSSAAHASACSSRAPRRRKLGSCPAETHSPAARSEHALLAEIFPRLVDPPTKPRPRVEERLVGDLDGRLAGRRLAVERQDPQATECVQDPVDRRVLECRANPARSRGTRRRVSGLPSPRVDETKEDLADRMPLVPGSATPHRLVRTRGQGPHDAAELPVGRECHTAVVLADRTSSVSVNWINGNAPGWWAASAIIAATRPGSSGARRRARPGRGSPVRARRVAGAGSPRCGSRAARRSAGTTSGRS